MTKCEAVDCDNERGRYGRYCSDVCMNTHIEVAAYAVYEMDGITTPSDVPDDRIAEIREKNQEGHDAITAKIEAQT